jgi:hypothetical protein
LRSCSRPKRFVIVGLKTAYDDSTTHLVLSSMEFIGRLAALVPRPRVSGQPERIVSAAATCNTRPMANERFGDHQGMWLILPLLIHVEGPFE